MPLKWEIPDFSVTSFYLTNFQFTPNLIFEKVWASNLFWNIFEKIRKGQKSDKRVFIFDIVFTIWNFYFFNFPNNTKNSRS